MPMAMEASCLQSRENLPTTKSLTIIFHIIITLINKSLLQFKHCMRARPFIEVGVVRIDSAMVVCIHSAIIRRVSCVAETSTR